MVLGLDKVSATQSGRQPTIVLGTSWKLEVEEDVEAAFAELMHQDVAILPRRESGDSWDIAPF
jgi:hypothetical protein